LPITKQGYFVLGVKPISDQQQNWGYEEGLHSYVATLLQFYSKPAPECGITTYPQIQWFVRSFYF